MERKQRKPLRLKEYDYSTQGAYFVTVCTKNKQWLFGDVGADSISARTISEIMQSFKRYSTVEYSKLVKEQILPPYDGQIWQRSFYDHIIRSACDFQEIWQYIQNNPYRWREDRFFSE